MNTNIPKIRQEIRYQILKFENQEYIKLIDTAGFIDKTPIFPLFIMEILQLANDGINEEQLLEVIKNNFGEYYQEIFNYTLEIINALDESGFMESPAFEELKADLEKYEHSPIRPTVCTGSSWSENLNEAIIEIDSILNASQESAFEGLASAIAIPHIDFRIPESHKVYSKAINSISKTNASLYVILGTAHYGNSDYFMFTDKNYDTPFGIVETELELLNSIKESLPEITIDNRSHKDEHSIEYQVVLLKRAFKHKFKILPILVGSLYEYIQSKELPKENSVLLNQINIIKEKIYEKYPDAIIIASGDLAHIGKRFDDDFAAREQLDQLRIEDKLLIEKMQLCSSDAFLSSIINVEDNRKVCGTAPFYSMLKLVEPMESQFLDYEQWDDFMTESAVSYASIAFKK